MRPNYAANILKLYGKVKLILSSKMPFVILVSYLLYFCHIKPIHTTHASDLKITALYFLLGNLLPFSPSSSALADPLGTTRKGRFLDLPLNFKCCVFKQPNSSIYIFGSLAP